MIWKEDLEQVLGAGASGTGERVTSAQGLPWPSPIFIQYPCALSQVLILSTLLTWGQVHTVKQELVLILFII